MATQDQVTELRELVDDTARPYVFEDLQLAKYIDAAAGDMRQAAGRVWTIRASSYAGLVDITEGASSRKNSQLYANALQMARYYGAEETSPGTPTPGVGRSGTRAIVRPE